jgi:fructokinase
MVNATLAPDALGPTICVGEILVEIVATTIGEGFLEAQPLMGPFPSGAPAIFIDQCGRLGGSAAMIGAVGDDDFGRLNTDRLKRDKIDISDRQCLCALSRQW